MFGLNKTDIDFIINNVKKYECIQAVGIYGSRSKGTYTKTSDIDIMLYGDNIDLFIVEELYQILEEQSPYPYYVDIKCFKDLKDGLFKAEVENNIKIIYGKIEE